MGKLFIVATPIGNLKDITLRALETLKEVDFILAEDTRVAKKLLIRYEINKPVISYHEHSKLEIYEKIFDLLNQDKNLALVSDAGTPLICDPGSKLINFLINKNKNIKIIPIPGPSAIAAALSISDILISEFTFLGYPPHKKARKKFFENIKSINYWPVVLYESPYRIQKTLLELKNYLGQSLELIICRELTKLYEEIWRGNIEEAIQYFNKKNIKGEFVLILKRLNN
ncbi:MAG: 16S rRNA (cytidine(1402)-2'-O)-methyltransferase [Patescibacteria group bacterium]|nr:16S rRNA (cytidine(1402)-2'-O)-methyltransferase [Patescibacteria group bacterium]MDW8279687.1 16S rRNA (cytidine(1402)-2'-O)-methyltransferase [bacterium]